MKLTLEQRVAKRLKTEETKLKKDCAVESVELYKELALKEATKRREEAETHRQEYEKLNYMYEDLKRQYYTDTGKKPILKSFTQIEIDKLKKENEVFQTENETIKSKLSRKGTGRSRANNTPDEEIIRLKGEGKSLRQIEAETGLSYSTVSRIIKLSLKQDDKQKGTQ